MIEEIEKVDTDRAKEIWDRLQAWGEHLGQQQKERQKAAPTEEVGVQAPGSKEPRRLEAVRNQKTKQINPSRLFGMRQFKKKWLTARAAPARNGN